MADKHQTLENQSSEDHGEDDELEELEVEVKQLAKTILHYRTTLPDQFKKTFASVLFAQRPVLLRFYDTDELGATGDRSPDAEHVESIKGALLAEEDPETTEKIHLLKLKISNNISAMPIILKRMNECISMVDKLDSYNGTTHLAFKRKKTS